MTAEHEAEGTSPTAQPPLTIFTIPLAEVFAEWERQYRADPTAFTTSAERAALDESPEETGEWRARTLVAIAREIAEARGVLA